MVFLGVLLVYAETGFVGGASAIGQKQGRTVFTDVDVNLNARSGGFAQAPLTARAPVAVVFVHGPCRRAHDGSRVYARRYGFGVRHVDGDGQIHDRYTTKHGRHLTYADGSAYFLVLRWYDQVLDGCRFRHCRRLAFARVRLPLTCCWRLRMRIVVIDPTLHCG